MKKISLKIASLVIILCLCLTYVSCNSDTNKTENFDLEFYLLNDGTYEVVGLGNYKGNDIVIPKYYNNKLVTSIGDQAFTACHYITSVVIPDSVTSIGDFAFHNCENLKTISIPDTITKMGHSIFVGCSNLQYNSYDNMDYLGNEENKFVVLMHARYLDVEVCEIKEGTRIIYFGALYANSQLTTIIIPKSVVYFEGRCFNDCRELEQFIVDKDNQNYESVNGLLYSKDHKVLVKCPEKYASDNVEFLDGVEIIDDFAFYDNKNITSMVIPNSVKSIGKFAFAGCSNLTNLVIGTSVTEIKYYAFSYCAGLTNIIIPDNVQIIGDRAFAYCNNLVKVTIGKNVKQIGANAFWNFGKLEEVIFQNPNNWKEELASFSLDGLADAQTAAKLLNEYNNHKWYRE